MKKEIIKPFNLEAYKNGAKIQTRDGNEVRIICTDVKNPYLPIVGLVKLNDNNELILPYTSEGKINTESISDNDLVIVEEVEEPEFWSDEENCISGFYRNVHSGISRVNDLPNNKYQYNVFATKKQVKSVIAMARISQIMANDLKNFGGAITDEEWGNDEWKYVIYRNVGSINTTSVMNDYYFLAFHTAEQRDLFLEKYRDLIRDFLMIG